MNQQIRFGTWVKTNDNVAKRILVGNENQFFSQHKLSSIMKMLFILALPLLQFFTSNQPNLNPKSNEFRINNLKFANSIDNVPPSNLRVTWHFCGGIPGCRHCCLTLGSPLSGAHEWEMHPVMPNGQYIYGGTPYLTKKTSGNSWHVGMIGDPDCFVIKYRQIGGQWQVSQKICPSSQCCYP